MVSFVSYLAYSMYNKLCDTKMYWCDVHDYALIYL